MTYENAPLVILLLCLLIIGAVLLVAVTNKDNWFISLCVVCGTYYYAKARLGA